MRAPRATPVSIMKRTAVPKAASALFLSETITADIVVRSMGVYSLKQNGDVGVYRAVRETNE